MIEHALALLEFERVRAAVGENCAGDQSRRLLESSPILTDPADVARELSRAVSLRKLLADGRHFPDIDLPDIEGALTVLKKEGTVLEGEALVALSRFIRSAGALKRFLSAREIEPGLREMAESTPAPAGLAAEIDRVFDGEGNVQYKNVPALRSIRESIRRLRAAIERTAAALLNNPETAGLFQTDTATVKDGRTVLPLKTKFKGRLKGIVHEVSGRGATLFLEPEEMVERNNELVVRENEFLAELLKIRRELTDRARGRRDDLGRMAEAVAYFDALLAKARWAHARRAVAALPAEGRIVLREARHPLLGKGAVPIDLALEPDERVLLITGPNTGGKTVTLKTVGLLACLNQFGMEIPAAEGTALPAFDCVFADIGDEQSLEQSLSTFQAHMNNVSLIVAHATARSLVLLDELGAGTDPQEGTAIAMALLDHFVEKNTMTFATTHHGVLKNYGFLKKGVVNASVEFDAEKLRPTYKIVMGIPGESHALAIAGRAGLPEALTRRATKYLDEERTDIAKLVEELVREKKQLREQGIAQQAKESAARDTLRRAELKELSLRQRERELRERGLGELERFLSESRRDLERIIREIREGANEEAVSRGRALVERLEERIGEERETVEKLAVPPPPGEIGPLEKGSRVRVRSSGSEGTIVREAKDGKFVVSVGNIRLTLASDELEAVPDVEPEVTVEFRPVHDAPPPAYELNVRGFRYADALRALEKQIDAVLVAGVKEFTILHGKGTGALRTGIHEYLASSPYVESYRFARPEQGGAGKTVVVMK
ncbi:MAG: endonuclease MutS2 [Spirochaetales bacterium]|nr:endonuclease MutS2 [Spirochaetales bacterium]